jgi:hypothetical protein
LSHFCSVHWHQATFHQHFRLMVPCILDNGFYSRTWYHSFVLMFLFIYTLHISEIISPIFMSVSAHWALGLNPLPLLFKSLLPGQVDCVFFSGHFNLHAKPETGITYREKNYNNQTKKDRMIILSDFIRQTTESYSFIHTSNIFTKRTTSTFSMLGTAGNI